MNILKAIIEKNYDLAREELHEELRHISASKIEEMKKMVASEMNGPLPFIKTRNQSKVAKDILEEDDEQITEARVRLIKARIRGGQIQRRKKVSNVPGYTLRGGQMTRMSASERRHRRLGAKKAARKVKGKMTRILMKRQRSLQKRKRLGL